MKHGTSRLYKSKIAEFKIWSLVQVLIGIYIAEDMMTYLMKSQPRHLSHPAQCCPCMLYWKLDITSAGTSSGWAQAFGMRFLARQPRFLVFLLLMVSPMSYTFMDFKSSQESGTRAMSPAYSKSLIIVSCLSFLLLPTNEDIIHYTLTPLPCM